MGKTVIGWTDETWNPVRGCSRVSEGCRHCYAEQQAARIVRMSKGKPCKYDGLVRITKRGGPAWTGRVAFDPETLAAPLGWRRPRRVFVNSMSDLFHEDLSNEQIAAVFGVMAAFPMHTFQVLTKRSRRMLEWFEWISRQTWAKSRWIEEVADAERACGEPRGERGAHDATAERVAVLRLASEALSGRHIPFYIMQPWPLSNVWMGVSVEDREHGVPRIGDLRATPAAVRMLSCEPLLEDLGPLDLTGIGWLIDGCESGEEARPAKPEWFASIERQCRAAGVAYFHKQEMVDGKLVHDFPGRQAFPEAR